ncbi:hypothetical protein [Stenotrophomonas phage RAS14]
MAIVCNSIVPPLSVSLPGGCTGFQQNDTYPSACGAGTSSATCNLNISGGVPPYNTSFSYIQTPNIVQFCTLNAAAFTGGGGTNPAFGFAFSGSNMCNIFIRGILQVAYTVTDSSGQRVDGNAQYDVHVERSVASAGCDCSAYGPRCYDVGGACRCAGQEYDLPCYL